MTKEFFDDTPKPVNCLFRMLDFSDYSNLLPAREHYDLRLDFINILIASEKLLMCDYRLLCVGGSSFSYYFPSHSR